MFVPVDIVLIQLLNVPPTCRKLQKRTNTVDDFCIELCNVLKEQIPRQYRCCEEKVLCKKYLFSGTRKNIFMLEKVSSKLLTGLSSTPTS